MANEKNAGNVDVTLDGPTSAAEKLLGKDFPCPLCAGSMPIRLTRKRKPYCQCLSCMLQLFFRGKIAIHRLEELVQSGILIAGNNSSSDSPIHLYNRLQLLKTQKIQLENKRSLLFPDDDLENAISAMEKQIAAIQKNLESIGQKSRRRK